MRKKLPTNEKRNNIIGIKVQQKTREQINYISKREDTPVSTIINKILKEYINTYFEIAKIDWDKIPPEEKGGIE